ncbi:hypothetical protein [Pseudohaliea sp.]|uniref:hypothetical protein n=1 Tax=Pseudohaliea sp. TaxID=2740289 RepID=UPI0032EF20CC
MSPNRSLVVWILSGFLLTGCKITAIISEGGRVISESGSYSCEAGDVCTFDIPNDEAFVDSFMALPAAGYEFVGWKKGRKFLCGGMLEPCSLSLKEGQVLEADVFIEPIFLPVDTVYTNAADPRIADITAEGFHITVVGDKNAEGVPVALREFSIVDSEIQRHLFKFDRQGRLVAFVDANGAYVSLEWDGQEVPSVQAGNSEVNPALVPRSIARANAGGNSGYSASVAAKAGKPYPGTSFEAGAGLSPAQIVYEFSDVAVNRCGQRVGPESAAVELRAGRADGTVQPVRTRYQSELGLFRTQYPTNYAEVLGDGLDGFCDGVATGMTAVCLGNTALTPVSINTICVAAAASSVGVGYAPCIASLTALNAALNVACADPTAAPGSPGVTGTDAVSGSCKVADKVVDYYGETQQFVSASAVAVNRETLRRFESPRKNFVHGPPDFLLEIGEVEIGDPVVTPAAPSLEDGYRVEFPVNDCAAVLGNYTVVVRRVTPPLMEEYDTIRIPRVGETESSISVFVPGVTLESGVSFDSVSVVSDGTILAEKAIEVGGQQLFYFDGDFQTQVVNRNQGGDSDRCSESGKAYSYQESDWADFGFVNIAKDARKSCFLIGGIKVPIDKLRRWNESSEPVRISYAETRTREYDCFEEEGTVRERNTVSGSFDGDTLELSYSYNWDISCPNEDALLPASSSETGTAVLRRVPASVAP